MVPCEINNRQLKYSAVILMVSVQLLTPPPPSSPQKPTWALSGYEKSPMLSQMDLAELFCSSYDKSVCVFPDGGAVGGHGEGEAGVGVHEGQAGFHSAVSV